LGSQAEIATVRRGPSNLILDNASVGKAIHAINFCRIPDLGCGFFVTEVSLEHDITATNRDAAGPVRCVWVLASSPVWNVHPSVDWLPAPDKIIAADGGSSLAAQLGLTPDLVIGDLDSSDPNLIQELESHGVQAVRFEHRTKIETDTELAALAALQWKPQTIILLGATGGRLDHTLANVLLLTHLSLADVDVRLIEGRQEAFLAKPGRWNHLNGEVGDMVSLLPVGSIARGVRTEGLEYPLNGEDLLEGRGRGVSNVILQSGARIWLDAGKLLIVLLHTGLDQSQE
jgi:thiamine pyrophosphokinase